MANNIPVFEFGKDSYILKHKLNYNTTHADEWSAVTYGVLFTDYDLARKTQLENAENYDPIILSGNTSDMNAIIMTYYDQEYVLGLFNRWSDTELVIGGSNFLNHNTIIASPNRTLTFDSGGTITSSGTTPGSFIADGYKVGDMILITGTTSNDGYKNISKISITGITVVEPIVTEPTYISDAKIKPTSTLVNDRRYQAYYVPTSYTILFTTGDYYNIYFHEIFSETGNTTWEHFGPSGETWVVTGTTENSIPWQVTGTTTENGYSTGVTEWTITDYKPILKYQARVIEVGSNYVKFERKLEDYVFNNLMKLASSTSYTTLFYTLESLSFCDKSYYGIKYVFEESKWNRYFTFTATASELTIQPIPNKEDLYFDYDNVRFKIIYSNGTEEYYSFFTDGLYTKYKLDRFLDQLGYDSGSTIYFDHSAVTNTVYTGSDEFDIELLNSGDTEFYRPYTYIYVYQSGGTEHICLILGITGNTLHLLSARVNMIKDEVITKINNMYTVEDISKMLYECYINIENYEDSPVNDFYGGNLYEPNQEGHNVIDPNLPGLWVFNPGD